MNRCFHRVHWPLLLLLLHLQGCFCLRCWVCGEDASSHMTNADSSVSAPRSRLKAAWCTSAITEIECDYDAQLCYKELWSVDGQQLVKRGCAMRDDRYELSGCEEQIRGGNNFNLVLCLCEKDLCNFANSLHPKFLIIFLTFVLSFPF